MLISARPDYLATKDERITLQQLDNMQKSLPANADKKIRARIERLKGVVTWNIYTQYQDRFTKASKHLRELDTDVEKLHKIYNSFVRTRQAATQSYRGYNKQILQLRIKIRHSRDTVKMLMARQGHMIEVMAINELEMRRKRLEQYQVKARFAMADSYDRATKAQQEQVIEKQKEQAEKQKEQAEKQKQEQDKKQQQEQPNQQQPEQSEKHQKEQDKKQPQKQVTETQQEKATDEKNKK
jgi:hypothetical protein